MNENPCPICGKKDQYRLLYEIDKGKRHIIACKCGHQSIFPVPTEDEFQEIYNEEYYNSWGVNKNFQRIFDLKLKTCFRLIKLANKYISTSSNQRRLLDIGCAFGYMLEAAQQYGYDSWGLEISHAADEAAKLGFNVLKVSLEETAFCDEYFDIVTGIDVIEHIPEPMRFLKECKRILKSGGILLLVTPNSSSLPARIMKNKWSHYKAEHLHYYSQFSIKKLLSNSGFININIKKAIKYLSLAYVTGLYEKYQPHDVETRIFKKLEYLFPQILIDFPLPFLSGMVVIGRKV